MTTHHITEMPKAPCVVLLSGGMDSSTLLAAIRAEGTPIAAAVFVHYGQRHQRERISAQVIAGHYGVQVVALDLRGYGASVKSALTDHTMDVPRGHYTADNMAQTVVPNRNATMLSAAAGVAASMGASVVATAVHAGDHAVYPDCRPEFIVAISRASFLGCGVEVVSPFVLRTKTDIAMLAGRLDVPLADTWSCYQGEEIHCGVCGTCVERAEAMHDAGIPDPTEYADPDFWRTAVAEHAEANQ